MGKPVETFPMDAVCLTLPAIITLLTTSVSVGFRSFNNVGASFDCNASDDADASGGLKDFNDASAPGDCNASDDAGAAPGLA